jgi:hypothetical protein
MTVAMATPNNHPPELPHDMLVEIAGHVAASSPRPLDDVSSLRASCRAMHAACGERAVGRRVALEREAAAMRWSDAGRYRSVVEHLARAGNPEACFRAGLALVFADPDPSARVPGAQYLSLAAAAGHKPAAYVLGMLHYDDATGYIRQVEGEVDENATKWTNRECERCRAQVADAVREVTWNVAAVLPVALLDDDEGRQCTAAGCGALQGWSNCRVFCSEECRIGHERALFFSMVPVPVSVS